MKREQEFLSPPRKNFLISDKDLKREVLIKVIIEDLEKHSKINIFCEGSGTESDPLIIKPIEGIPNKIHISFYYEHILIKDFKCKQLSISRSLHLKIVDSEFEKLYLANCRNANLINLNIKDRLKLNNCFRPIVENCIIHGLFMKYSHESKFYRCVIDRVDKFRINSANLFERCQISEKGKRRILNNKYQPGKITLITIPVFSWIMLKSIEVYLLEISRNWNLHIWSYTFLFLGIISVILILYADLNLLKELKRNDPPNKIK